ncbi:transposase [Thermodesulfobacteriota bacterium]
MLEYLDKTVERYEIKIHTYCLMSYHFHILVEISHPNLSQAIKWINVSHAAYFNPKRRKNRPSVSRVVQIYLGRCR